jgi:tetratricopeptide (TPR) repeat protein
MLNPKDISNYNNLTKDQKRSFEKAMQETDLNYLSSVAFEQFSVSNQEIEKLNTKIDKNAKGNSTSFNTIFISVLCGLLIGVSVFFVVFQKNKNHPSVYQSLTEEKAQHKLENNISSTDTLFPEIERKEIEHYNIIANNAEEITTPEVLEPLPSKPIEFNLSEMDEEEDLVFQFTANAPVVFIHNMKVTNYRLYYFKNSYAIDLNSSIPAQYGSQADIETAYLNKSNTYLAHKLIKKAMWFFNVNNINKCLEELTILYNYNHDDANAQFYLGMCYYQLGKYTTAKNFFQKNLDNINNVFHQESEFYQALCLLNLKQTDEGIKQLQNIANNRGFYSVRAKEALDKLNK